MTLVPNFVAAVQMVSTPDVQENIATARRLVGQAAANGAGLVVLPEYWPVMGMSDTDKVALAEQLGSGIIQATMAELASTHGIWLFGGTLPLVSGEAGKVLNTTLVFDPSGAQVSRYDKIHLFGFATDTESYDEARTIVPGKHVGTVETGAGKVGMAICYDLRFPELFRAMGPVDLIVVPAAFTYTTGAAHWDTLLRARAIENQCYVLAAAQGGTHVNGRRTWGHSQLIDPWGEVRAIIEEGEGVCGGLVDRGLIDSVRQKLPALRHRTM